MFSCQECHRNLFVNCGKDWEMSNTTWIYMPVTFIWIYTWISSMESTRSHGFEILLLGGGQRVCVCAIQAWNRIGLLLLSRVDFSVLALKGVVDVWVGLGYCRDMLVSKHVRTNVWEVVKHRQKLMQIFIVYTWVSKREQTPQWISLGQEINGNESPTPTRCEPTDPHQIRATVCRGLLSIARIMWSIPCKQRF